MLTSEKVVNSMKDIKEKHLGKRSYNQMNSALSSFKEDSFSAFKQQSQSFIYQKKDFPLFLQKRGTSQTKPDELKDKQQNSCVQKSASNMGMILSSLKNNKNFNFQNKAI